MPSASNLLYTNPITAAPFALFNAFGGGSSSPSTRHDSGSAGGGAPTPFDYNQFSDLVPGITFNADGTIKSISNPATDSSGNSGQDPNNPNLPVSGDPRRGLVQILNSFSQFGYTPTADEVKFLASSTAGGNDQTIQQAVGAYSASKSPTAEAQRKSDPLYQEAENQLGIQADATKEISSLTGQLQTSLGQAPTLFGNLTPDQINTLLAPLNTQFQRGQSQLTTTLGSRGLTGSSVEANALADANATFNQGVAQYGLQIGMQQQQNQQATLAQLINSYIARGGTAGSGTLAGLGQLSSQGQTQSLYNQQLPILLQQLGLQGTQIANQNSLANQGPSPWALGFGAANAAGSLAGGVGKLNTGGF
jgi:hypothetical protein